MFEGLKKHWQVFRESWRFENDNAAARQIHADVEFLPAALEVMESPASPAGRMLVWILVALFTVALGWSWFGHVDVVATAQGKTVPTARVKHIQAAEMGVVRAVHVVDGQLVRTGDPLIELDPTFSEADVAQAQQNHTAALTTNARTRALVSFIDGDAPVFDAPLALDQAGVALQRRLIGSRIGEYEATERSLTRQLEEAQAERSATIRELAKLEETLPLLDEQMAARRELMDKGLSPKLLYLELQERHVSHTKDIEIQKDRLIKSEAAIRALESRREQYRQEFRREVLEELTKVEDEVKLRAAELDKATRRSALQLLASPVDGKVQQVAVHTIGGVVQAAEPLMVIVPRDGKLQVEAMVLNKDVGSIEVGDPVEVKLEAFPFTKYGVIHGTLENVSLDAIEDENLGLVYAAIISLDQNTIMVQGREVALTPGMSVTTEIKTGERRLIEFLLAPLLRYRDEALRER